jgi:hypothetical protein
MLANPQRRSDWLRDLHQHAAAQAHDDLLARDRLVMLLLDFIADYRSADCTSHHRDIATGAASDQTSNPEPGQTANHGAEALVMIGRNLGCGDLLDHAALDLHCAGLRAWGRTCGYQQCHCKRRDQ